MTAKKFVQYFVISLKLLIGSGTVAYFYKLSSAGITGNLHQWFTSYLSSRQQRVVYANSSSHWSTINAGVPQGLS